MLVRPVHRPRSSESVLRVSQIGGTHGARPLQSRLLVPSQLCSDICGGSVDQRSSGIQQSSELRAAVVWGGNTPREYHPEELLGRVKAYFGNDVRYV